MAPVRHLPIVLAGLRTLLRRDSAERDLDEEIRHYLDRATEEHVRSASGAGRRLASSTIGGCASKPLRCPMDVGLELRKAREQRGVSLQQISGKTKISLRVLQAIEAGDEHRVPAPVFTRAFVKAYAREVGLDPEQTVRDYTEQFAPPEAASAPDEPAQAPPPPRRWQYGTPIVLLLVSLTVVALAVKNYRHANANQTRTEVPAAASAAGAIPAATPHASPVGTSGTAPAPANDLHLSMAPTGPCWVQATVGGENVLTSLMNAGDRKTVDSPSDVTLRVGDPAAFVFTINGAPARVPGAQGQAVTVHITKENYRTFLTR